MAILTVLESRGVWVDPASEERIVRTVDSDELQRLIARAATVATAPALFHDPSE
jgi:hypothetical protein